EEALKIPNLLEEFRDDSIKLIGFPERISTKDFSSAGQYGAHADSSFNTIVQRVLAALGVRYHYGHPDFWDTTFVQTRGGVSSQTELNEDIIKGYETRLQGFQIVYREYLRAVKGREVSVTTSAGLFRKFGMGAGQQAYSRFMFWLNDPLRVM